LAAFGALWVGKPLSKIEQLCLASFVYHGHSVTLYVYDKDMAVPAGVVKKDANDIIPESKLFVVDNSYGPFADMFRYEMIRKTGLIWTDTDNVCLRSDWEDEEYIFGEQGGQEKLVAIGIIKAPKNSALIKDLVKESSAYDKTKIVWGEIGPQLITKLINRHGLEKFAKPKNAFYPIDYWMWKMLWNKTQRNVVFRMVKDSYTLQIWNQMLSREGYDKNKLPPGSVVDYYYRKFVLNEN
jgi:hypothetical protein